MVLLPLSTKIFAAAVAAGAVIVKTVLGHDGIPVNNENLGVPGFPDCVQTDPDAARRGTPELTLECSQRPADFQSQIAVACVGDSITAGACSSGRGHTYPDQLGRILGRQYMVTNLGACGSTLQMRGDSPYWERPQFEALVRGTWDVVVIMLGTNDAKDLGHNGPDNWRPHDCLSDDGETIDYSCPFAEDYSVMIEVVRTLGRQDGGRYQEPTIFVAVPPPLMRDGACYGMNRTVINRLFPVLIPGVARRNRLTTDPIDVFSALGGNDTTTRIPDGGCAQETGGRACPYFCDSQSCNQCHPNDVGYRKLAETVAAAIVKSSPEDEIMPIY